MSLAARAEVIKLAHELSVDATRVAFLADLPADDLTEVRRAISAALYARHEPRLKRLAALSKVLPAAVSARIAKIVAGPLLSARVAGVLDAPTAVKLSGHFDPTYLANVAEYLDPARTAPIIAKLPAKLSIDVARVLLRREAYVVMGRLIAAAPDEVVLPVVEDATGLQLLQVSFYAEDRKRLDDLAAKVSDQALSATIQAAADSDHFDEALSLFTFLAPASQIRLADIAAALDPATLDGVVAATVRLGVWDELVPILGRISDTARRAFLNVPTTLDPGVAAEFLAALRRAGDEEQTRAVLDALDEPHRAVAESVGA